MAADIKLTEGLYKLVPEQCGDFCPIVRTPLQFDAKDIRRMCAKCPIDCCMGPDPLFDIRDYYVDALKQYLKFWRIKFE